MRTLASSRGSDSAAERRLPDDASARVDDSAAGSDHLPPEVDYATTMSANAERILEQASTICANVAPRIAQLIGDGAVELPEDIRGRRRQLRVACLQSKRRLRWRDAGEIVVVATLDRQTTLIPQPGHPDLECTSWELSVATAVAVPQSGDRPMRVKLGSTALELQRPSSESIGLFIQRASELVADLEEVAASVPSRIRC